MTDRRHTMAGFTLVEVMLTTVLAAVLLVALWSLLSMYSKAFEGGHARTEQSQLARALLELVSTDLQSVLVAPPPAPSVVPAAVPNGAVESLTASLSNRLPLTFDGGIDAPQGHGADVASHSSSGSVATSSLRPAGLFGTSTFLQLDVLQPAMLPAVRTSEEFIAADPDAPPRADELKTVTYAFEEYRDPANPTAAAETRLVRRELNWAQAHPARDRETERTLVETPSRQFGAPAASSEFDPASQPAAVAPAPGSLEPGEFEETSVPEVLAFELRYFDGTLWSAEWDSVSRQGLPAAIEVSLRLRSAEEPPAAMADPASKPGVDRDKVEQWKHPTSRLLIPLTLARKSSAASGPSSAASGPSSAAPPFEIPNSTSTRADGRFLQP